MFYHYFLLSTIHCAFENGDFKHNTYLLSWMGKNQKYQPKWLLDPSYL